MGAIAVLGTGPSVSLYDASPFDLSIGVNDVWKFTPTDYLVCLDKPERFTPDRLAVINESMPIRFYTQIEDWKSRPDYQAIELQVAYPKYECDLDDRRLPKSLCSPFVAAVIAYKFHRADRIELFGVDLDAHPYLKDGSLDKIKLHFSNLFSELRLRGVYVKVNGDGILRSL